MDRTWIIPTSGSILLGALFPILASQVVKELPPFLTMGITYGIALLIFLVITLLRGKFSELRNTRALRYAVLGALIIGVFNFGLYYYGLQFTSPGNAALIAQTELIFSFIFFQLLKKEPLSKLQIIGALFVIVGAIYLLLPKSVGLNRGDFFILAAMAFGPIGNYFQKQGSHLISTTTMLLIRFLVAFPLVMMISAITRESLPLTVSPLLIGEILAIAILVNVCKKIFWLESIKNITVSRVLALHGLIPFLTIIFAWILLGTSPTVTQLIAGIPMLLGVILLAKK